jgi:hypothetical protein
MRPGFMRLWKWPIAIAAITLLGLIAGLVGDGGWDWLAAICLGLPVVLSVWLGVMRR